MQDRAYGLRRIHQPVEKVGIEPMATTNRLRKPQNRRIWRAIRGRCGHQGGFSTGWHVLGSPQGSGPTHPATIGFTFG